MAKKQSYLKKKQTFSGAQVLLFVLIFAAVGAVAIWQSLAAPHNGSGGGGGKPSKGGSGTLALVMVTDNNGDGSPNWGDTVTFNISTTATTQPNVSLTCSQNSKVVYSASAGFYDSYPWPWTKNMTLSSQTWAGGSADCVANLYYISGTRTVSIGNLNFHVNA